MHKNKTLRIKISKKLEKKRIFNKIILIKTS